MKPKLGCWVLCMCIYAASSAQISLGLGGGFLSNQLLSNLSGRPEKYAAGYGLFVPLSADLHLCKHFYLDLAVSYAQKSYMLDRTDSFMTLNTHYRNEYLQLQVAPAYSYLFCHQPQGRVSPVPWARLIVFAGAYGAYWAAGHLTGAVPNLINTAVAFPSYSYIDQAYSFDPRRDNRWEWGLQAGFSFQYLVSPDSGPFLAMRFYQGETDQQKAYMQDQVPRYNRSFGFAFGLIKSFGGLKEGCSHCPFKKKKKQKKS